MMGRSKDHRSAGLWWSLLLSGGSLGGHGRLLKSFQSLIITFVSTGVAVDYSVTKSTVTSGQRKLLACLSSFLISVGTDLGGHGRPLGLSVIVSSSPSFTAAGAAADCLVIEFAVDRWVIRRGPLDGVEDQPLSSFLVFGWCYHRPFFLEPCSLSVG